jgi:ABC-type lipoprotein export system ATPase subunit
MHKLTKEQLLKYVQPDETATEFLQRHVREALPTGIPLVDQHVTFRPGQILEVVGPSGSGKSELLIQVRR